MTKQQAIQLISTTLEKLQASYQDHLIFKQALELILKEEPKKVVEPEVVNDK